MSRVILLVVILPMTFRTFAFFPLLSKVQEVWNVLCLLYLLLVYPGWLSRKSIRVSRFELYSIMLIAVVPFLSAFTASREFGQPFIYGLLTQRSLAAIAAILYLRRAYLDHSFVVAEIERALLILCWGTFFLFLAIKLLFDPSNFSDLPGFVSVTQDGTFFVLPGYFILFGIFYYLLRGFREKRKYDYFLAFLLFAGSSDRKGLRQTLLYLSLTFLFFVYRWSDRKRLLSFFPKMALTVAVLVGALFAVMPSVMLDQIARLRDVFTVISTRSNVDVADPSAAARVGETLVAVEGIVRHPVLGNGFVSHQWEGGPESVLGERFNAFDVGILGIWYSLGIVGLILFAAQFGFVRTALKILPKGSQSPLLDALKGLLLFLAAFSLTAGAFVADVTVTLFFIMLLNVVAAEFASAQARGACLPAPG